MPGYAAFVRGVSPVNLKMPELKNCLEKAGFTDVKTVLASGNVVFTSRSASEPSVGRQAEEAMRKGLKRDVLALVRSIDGLERMLQRDPYSDFRLPNGSKRVVTFLRAAPKKKPSLPLEVDGARILCAKGEEVYTAYVVGPRGPVFMQLIEKTYGQHVTTRSWDTVRKVVNAYEEGPAKGPAKKAPKSSSKKRRTTKR